MINAQSITVHLAPSNYNNYNISCFGAKDGYIHATVTGGTPPYHYKWSNGETTQNVTTLAAGYYGVYVEDANGAATKAEITLEEPKQLEYGLQPVIYPNGFNTTCFFCNDGAIDIDISGGITPYTFNWSDGSVFQNRTGLQAKPYQVIISDANGCIQKETGVTLSAPERNDWTTNGNTGTNPGSHFIGTTDSTDFVFKSNSIERVRIKGNGSFQIKDLAGNGDRDVIVDENGRFQARLQQYWSVWGNNNIDASQHFIGPTNNQDLVFKTGNSSTGTLTERMRITKSGAIGIGMIPNAADNSLSYKLVVDGKVGVREIYVKASGAWPDYVFTAGYRTKTLTELDKIFKEKHRFPQMPSAEEIKNGGQPVGQIQLSQQQLLEEAYLHLIAIDKRVNKIEKENHSLRKENAAIKKELKKLRDKK